MQIIWGTEDTLFSEQDQRDVQERLVNAPTVEFTAIEGASHGVFTDSTQMAEHVAGLIDGFVQRQSA